MNTVTPKTNGATPEWAELRPCQCNRYEDADSGDRLECDGVTYRTFAIGHDARLKGFLIRTGRQLHAVRVVDTDEIITPLEAANRYGFGKQVLEGIKRAPKKPRKTLANRPTKANHKAADTEVRRVGRWSYPGRVQRVGGKPVFVYRDRQGNERRTHNFQDA